jgi:hypothetical protein
MNYSVILFFLKNILPINLVVDFIFIIVLSFIIPKIIPFKININKYLKSKSFWIYFVLLVFVIAIIPFIFNSKFTSPYLNSFNGLNKVELEIYNSNKLNTIDYSEDFDNLFKEIDYLDPNSSLKYKKILVFIAEGLPFNDFKKELDSNNSTRFFTKYKNQEIMFNNYYTNNQDSRTAVISMLSGVFIPFEAYTDLDWHDLYFDKILKRNNLVNYFNDINYSTQFVISSVELPAIGFHYNWQKQITIDDKNKFNFFKKDNICLHVLEYQHGCEDKVILDKVKDTIKNTDNLFLVQEFIFGHSNIHLELAKMNRTQYYDLYIGEIYDFLEQEQLLDDTLIVFVGDHGSKNYHTMRNYKGYSVPLMFMSNKLNFKVVSGIYSHINFADILYSVIKDDNCSEIIVPKNNLDYTLFYGSTNSNVVGFVNNKGLSAIYDATSNSVIKLYDDNMDFDEINYMYNLIYNYKTYFNNIK